MATSRRAIGLKVEVPPAAGIEAGPPGTTLYAVERLADGRLCGELELQVISPGLIIDRAGVLLEAAQRLTDEFLAPPRDGYLLQMARPELDAGPAWRLDAVLQRGRDGRMPELPYQSVVALGHPDLSLAVALLVIVRSRQPEWPAGEEILSSLRFTGVPAGAATAAIVLPLPV